MRIIYIAGAVRGTEDAGTRFFGAEEQLTEKGYSVLNPLDLPYLADLPEEKSWISAKHTSVPPMTCI